MDDLVAVLYEFEADVAAGFYKEFLIGGCHVFHEVHECCFSAADWAG
mgnify:CR=1 FL=1